MVNHPYAGIIRIRCKGSHNDNVNLSPRYGHPLVYAFVMNNEYSGKSTSYAKTVKILNG